MILILNLLIWAALGVVAQSAVEFPNAITAEFTTIAHQIPEVVLLCSLNRIDIGVSSARETLHIGL